MKKIFLIFLLITNIFSADIETAKKLFDEEQKYEQANKIFMKNLDNSESQYYIGKAYLYGMGIEKNVKKAFEFAKKSSSKNNSSGLNLLGVLYQYGEGVEKNELEALKYYKEAANFNNTKAMKNLGKIYFLGGERITKDYGKAEKWFLKAYELGDTTASYDIAQFYASTEIKQCEKAIHYYKIYKNTNPINLDYVYSRIGDCYYELNQYQDAYSFYSESAKLNNSYAMVDIYTKFSDYSHIVSNQIRFFWLKKAALEFDNKFAISFLINQMSMPKKDRLESLTKLYQKGNLEAGCKLAAYYSNL